jgi:hypothetical protein
MEPADLRRYHRLLLKKQREVSFALGEAQSRVPAAGGLEVISFTKRMPTRKRSCRFTERRS